MDRAKRLANGMETKYEEWSTIDSALPSQLNGRLAQHSSMSLQLHATVPQSHRLRPYKTFALSFHEKRPSLENTHIEVSRSKISIFSRTLKV